MTPADKRLAARLLQVAEEEFGNHGCNDFDLVADGGMLTAKLSAGWAPRSGARDEGMLASEADDLRRRFYAWNGDPENYEPGKTYQPDFAAMGFLAHLLEEEGLGE